MICVYARYRGREKARAQLVERSAEALASLPGVAAVGVSGIDEITASVTQPEDALNMIMALLSDGQWAIGVGVASGTDDAADDNAAQAAERAAGSRAGQVHAQVVASESSTAAADLTAVFALLAYVLHKRTMEGREATSLVRRGLTQNEAASELGISKQAMSQRLQAAGWPAERAGWQLALNLLTRAAQPD